MKKASIGVIIICMIFLLTACKSEEVKSVEQQISAIGDVSQESYDKIQEAIKSYDNLSNEEKENVSNYNLLEKAENIYYAMRVDEIIENLGPINVESRTEIDYARMEYEKLSKAQRSNVNLFGKLIKTEKEYGEYIVNKSIDTLKSLSSITPDDLDSIELAEYIYNKLTEKEKDLVGREVDNPIEVIEKVKVDRTYKLIERIDYKKGDPSIEQLKIMIDALTAYLDIEIDSVLEVKNYEKLEEATDKFSEYMEERVNTDQVLIRKNYISECEEISYEELMKYPQSYKGQKVVMEVEILKIEEGILMLSDKIAAFVIETDNAVELKDNRPVKEPKILEGNTLKIYGEFEDTKTVSVKEEGTGWFGTTIFENVTEEFEIPVIKLVYTDEDNLGVLATGKPDSNYIEIYEKAEKLRNQLNQLIEQ